MPVMNGIEATKQMTLEMPDSRIVILTSYADKDYVIPPFKQGAKAYQLKDVAPEKLLSTMIEVQNGTYQLDGHITTFRAASDRAKRAEMGIDKRAHQ